MTRLEQLQAFYNDDPHDPFNLYGLALEVSRSDAQKAVALFEVLLEEHPSYIPAYYQAAKLNEAIKKNDRAIEIYRLGIDRSKKQNEFKALRELQSALDELLYE
jgi:hypothetical protein